MTPTQQLNFLRESQSFRVIQALIAHLIGAELQFFSSDDIDLACCPEKNTFREASAFSHLLGNRETHHWKDGPCLHDLRSALMRAVATKTPVRGECPEGKRCFFLPILMNAELVGAIKFVENENFPLNAQQEKTIVELLQNTIENFAHSELSLVMDFSGQDLTHHQKIIQRVLHYINENYQIPELSLADVSRQCGVSYFYLSRLFKTQLKKNFSNYLSRLRMEVAVRLLKDRSLTINQIALACGFDDAGYFCKVFKKTYGHAPLTYRKNQIASVRSKLSRRLHKELA